MAIVDARTDLVAARGLCRLLGTTGTSAPVVAVLNEGGLVSVLVTRISAIGALAGQRRGRPGPARDYRARNEVFDVLE